MTNDGTTAFSSPRIAALQHALEAGNADALDTFWQTVAQEGTPLIELIPDEETHALVTFVWRADAGTTHVVLHSELLRGMWWNGWADALLTRLLDTNLFYRTYRVPMAMRLVYWFVPNHPLLHPRYDDDWDDLFQIDPLNPRVFVQDLDRSYVEMPAAPPQPWFQARPSVPAGTVRHLPWHSTLLDNDRNVWVYTPSGYTTDGEPYHLLLLFDGDVYTTWIPAPIICDNLIAAGRIPPLVIVMLDSPARGHELYYDEAFVAFLTEELMPWVRQNYHVTTDPRHSIVGGVSAGGLAAAFVGLRHSGMFGNVLSQSGVFHWSREAAAAPPWSYEIPPPDEWLIQQFVVSTRLPLRFYLDAGLLEDHRDPSITTLLRANRHMRDVLQAKGYDVQYVEFCGGHQYINWRGTLPNGLMTLLDAEHNTAEPL